MSSSVKSFVSKPIDKAFVIVFWGESNRAFILQMANSLWLPQTGSGHARKVCSFLSQLLVLRAGDYRTLGLSTRIKQGDIFHFSSLLQFAMKRKQKRFLQMSLLFMVALIFLPNIGLWSLYKEKHLVKSAEPGEQQVSSSQRKDLQRTARQGTPMQAGVWGHRVSSPSSSLYRVDIKTSCRFGDLSK